MVLQHCQSVALAVTGIGCEVSFAEHSHNETDQVTIGYRLLELAVETAYPDPGVCG